ncbi:MAG: DUF4422 domain-containing protein [Elusimicrobiaceae bacterium]|nr:DUF4422 domain-containing protein [Elusimicrobiaceae bacterium]
MMKSNIKIFVTYKEKNKVLRSNIISPIQTGRAISNEVFENMLGDDTGDNISKENPCYNELSAQYWVWKHYEEIGNPDYVGFMHYRRHFLFNEAYEHSNQRWLNHTIFFEPSITTSYIETNLSDLAIQNAVLGNDILILKKIDIQKINPTFRNIRDCYTQNVPQANGKNFDILIESILQLYPELQKEVNYLKTTNFQCLCNMFVMKKELFFEYSSFLFKILENVTKKIDIQGYSSQALRFCGYFGEMLLTLFVHLKEKNSNLKIKQLDGVYFLNTKEQEELFPVFQKNNVAVAMSSSNEYVPYLSVCLQSLQDHVSKDHNYDIVVFERNITDENKAILKKQIEQENISLRFYNPVDLFEKYNLHYPSCYNLECYFRLVSPYIFRHYKKIVFTDVDLLFNADIAELYDINIDKYPLGAVQDYIWGIFVNNPKLDWREYARDVLNLENLYNYFNTGVMLLNVEEFNKNRYSNKLLELVSHTQFRILEQDGLNKFFQSTIKYIPSAWNFPTLNSVYKSMIEWMPYEFAVKYKQDRLSPKIIHFAGSEKPWYYLENEMADIWWKYARKTPFYEMILEMILERKWKHEITQLSANTNLLFNYHKNLLHYYKYKIILPFVWGNLRVKYNNKKSMYKQKVSQARHWLSQHN